MKFPVILFILTITGMSVRASEKYLSKPRACLVSFLSNAHVFNEIIKENLEKYKSNAIFLQEAKPKDLSFCIKQDVEEIILLGHAVKLREFNKGVNLLYFDGERYRPIATRAFQAFREELQTQGTRSLQKLRVLFCFPEAVLEHYALHSLSTQFGIHIEIADPSRVAQMLNGFEDVSSLDYRWLAESFQREDGSPDAPDKAIFFYLHSKTFIVYQFAEKNVLNGRYSVSLQGISVGLEEKWRMFWISQKQLQDIEVGDSKGFWIPTFGFSFSLAFLGIEVQSIGQDRIQTPFQQSDTDGLGVSLGLVAHIVVTRIY